MEQQTQADDVPARVAEIRARIKAREEQKQRERLANGIYAVGDRVDARDEANDDWSHYRGPFSWSDSSSVGEVALVRRSPPAPATYDVRFGDGRVVEAVPLERIRRARTRVIAPDGKPYCSSRENPQDLIIQASCVGDVATVEMCLDAGMQILKNEGWRSFFKGSGQFIFYS